MSRTAEGVRVLRGCPPYALNVYPACFGHGPRYATGGGHCASRRLPAPGFVLALTNPGASYGWDLCGGVLVAAHRFITCVSSWAS